MKALVLIIGLIVSLTLSFGCARTPPCQGVCATRARLGPLCKNGDGDACRRLGHAHTAGGNERGEVAAAQWHMRGCDLGVLEACRYAAMYYRTGPGFEPPQPARALACYSKGCDLDDNESCYDAAKLLLDGPESLRDDALGASLLKRSIDARSKGPRRRLALLHRDGRGVDQAPDAALRLLRQACAAGDGRACVEAGFFVWIGFGEKASSQRALVMLEKGCQLGEGCGLAGLLERPPRNKGGKVIVGQLVGDPDQGIRVFHASDEPPTVGASAELYSAITGERATAWAAVASGPVKAAGPNEIRMWDTSDIRLKMNFSEGSFVALTWSGEAPASPQGVPAGGVADQ